jgi:hypothetical protein
MKESNDRFDGTVSKFATRNRRKHKFGYLMIIFSVIVLLYNLVNCKYQHGNSAQYNGMVRRSVETLLTDVRNCELCSCVTKLLQAAPSQEKTDTVFTYYFTAFQTIMSTDNFSGFPFLYYGPLRIISYLAI